MRVGEWIEVRSKAEILETLDKRGQLDGLPFMPEMFAFCGKRFRVFKRAHKTCDTVFPVRGRKMFNAVHLETRCDGQAHAGCQAGCLIFWKEVWLKRSGDTRIREDASNGDVPAAAPGPQRTVGCSEQDVLAAAKASVQQEGADPAYVCQATLLPYATESLPWWEVRQYFEDYRSGNVGLRRMACGFIYMGFRNLINAGLGLGPPLRWFYDFVQRLWGGVPYPRWRGSIPVGDRTPASRLNLQEGEWVRVRSYRDILDTLDQDNKNRGLQFDAEMVPYCGGTYRVLKRVTRILNERTGKIQEFKTPCFILEGVFCQSRYSECRLFCPRSIYSYWREIWLERVPQGQAGLAAQAVEQTAG